jgi:hypothetical protein
LDFFLAKESTMKMRQLLAFVACLPVGAAVLYGASKAPPKPEVSAGISGTSSPDRASLEDELNAALKARENWAEQALEASQAAYDSGTITLDMLIDSANELVTAELAVASTRIQKLAALEKHVERIASMEQKIAALYTSGSRGGEAVQYRLINRELADAKIMLIEARLDAI